MCTGGVSAPELLKTFNCGIGAIIIVSASDAESVLELITHETPRIVGTVEVQTGEGKWCGCAVTVTWSQSSWSDSAEFFMRCGILPSFCLCAVLILFIVLSSWY